MPNDYVTIKQFDEFKGEMREFKLEMLEFKDEMLDFKAEMFEFKDVVFKQYDQKEEDHQRQIGAIKENNEHWAKFIIEALRIDIERLDRKFVQNDEDHQKFDKCISRAEVATL